MFDALLWVSFIPFLCRSSNIVPSNNGHLMGQEVRFVWHLLHISICQLWVSEMLCEILVLFDCTPASVWATLTTAFVLFLTNRCVSSLNWFGESILPLDHMHTLRYHSSHTSGWAEHHSILKKRRGRAKRRRVFVGLLIFKILLSAALPLHNSQIVPTAWNVANL